MFLNLLALNHHAPATESKVTSQKKNTILKPVIVLCFFVAH